MSPVWKRKQDIMSVLNSSEAPVWDINGEFYLDLVKMIKV